MVRVVRNQLTRSVVIVAVAAFASTWPPGLHAQGPKQVKVSLEFRQSGAQSQEAVQGSGRVVITEKGGPRPSARLGVESRETRIEQSSGIFILVHDGGAATLSVATQVPVICSVAVPSPTGVKLTLWPDPVSDPVAVVSMSWSEGSTTGIDALIAFWPSVTAVAPTEFKSARSEPAVVSESGFEFPVV